MSCFRFGLIFVCAFACTSESLNPQPDLPNNAGGKGSSTGGTPSFGGTMTEPTGAAGEPGPNAGNASNAGGTPSEAEGGSGNEGGVPGVAGEAGAGGSDAGGEGGQK